MADIAVDQRDDGSPAAAATTSASVRGNRDFVKLWSGESVSFLGSTVTEFTLPLVALLTLQATPFQVGLLTVAWSTPFLLSLFVGVWVDRHRRRPILIGTNLARAVAVGLVPLAAVFGLLSMPQLYVAAFVLGALTVPFDLAYLSYVPSLVDRRQLADANGKLVASATLADIGGRPLAGFLVPLLSAPIVLVVDAVSYLWSAAFLMTIRKREPEPVLPTERRTLRTVLADIREGLQLVFSNSHLRVLAGEAATFNLFESLILVIFPYYAITTLGLSPALLAIVITSMGVGALVGSLTASRLQRRLGFGRALLLATVVGCCAPALLLVANGSGTGSLAIMILSFLVHGVGFVVANILAVTFRQSVTPDRLQGRLHASYRVLIYGSIPVGGFLGGALGSAVGLLPTLAVGVTGLSLAVFWILLSSIRKLQSLPDPVAG
ncbi:MAG: MFS transporter [Pseudonocardiales bacterium]